MSGATNPRIGFNRWVASLKRDATPGAGGPPAAPSFQPTSSAARSALDELPKLPALLAEHDRDATRVHHIPKEIIHSLRARSTSESPKVPEDERTCVFRAPPELLERAKRAQASSDPPSDVLTAPSQDLLVDPGFGDALEARSGVSLIPQPPPPSREPEDPAFEVQEPLAPEEPLHVEIDDGGSLPGPEEAKSLFAGAPVAGEMSLGLPYDTRLERPSEIPAFRQPLVSRRVGVALLVALGALVVWCSPRLSTATLGAVEAIKAFVAR